MEIERKWLVDKTTMPSLENPEYRMSNDVGEIRIEQHYLNTMADEWLIRVRAYGHLYVLELKSQGMLSREEIAFKITQSEFLEAIKHSKKSLKKTRYYLRYAGHMFEFNKYDDYDFITCEVEFKTEEEAKNFIPPKCCVLDVTEDPKYKNVNLAK